MEKCGASLERREKGANFIGRKNVVLRGYFLTPWVNESKKASLDRHVPQQVVVPFRISQKEEKVIIN